VLPRAFSKTGIDVENVQDVVERKLMEYGHYDVARRYIVYREDRAKARALRGESEGEIERPREIKVLRSDGSSASLEWEQNPSCSKSCMH
jgi:ribonucleoside-diphosphate reductase alpha chain